MVSNAFGDANSWPTAKNQRKNLKEGGDCNPQDQGVDLDRNYDYEFGQSSEGSSADPCKETYRGETAFSEPETQAVKQLVSKYPNLVSAMNFFSAGGVWARPFSSGERKGSDWTGLGQLKSAYEFFEENAPKNSTYK